MTSRYRRAVAIKHSLCWSGISPHIEYSVIQSFFLDLPSLSFRSFRKNGSHHHPPVVETSTLGLHEREGFGVVFAYLKPDFLADQHLSLLSWYSSTVQLSRCCFLITCIAGKKSVHRDACIACILLCSRSCPAGNNLFAIAAP